MFLHAFAALFSRQRWGIWTLVLGLTLLQGVIWLQTTPPWAAPDEPGHFLYVQLFAQLGRPPRPQDVAPEHWQRILASMEAHDWQTVVHPDGGEGSLAQDPTLLASGSQIGQKPPGYYALAAFWLRLLPHWQTQSPATQLLWLRRLSLALHLLTTAVALGLAWRLWPDAPDRALSVGLLVGLLPMVGFIGTSVNNDALTMLWGTVGFAALLLARSRPAWAFILLWIGLGPLLVDVGLLFLWPLALGVGIQRIPRLHKGGKGIVLFPTLILIPILILLPNPRWAAGWRRQGLDRSRADGQLFLQAEKAPARLSQTLSGLLIVQRQGQPLTLEAEASGAGGDLVLRLSDEAGRSEIHCPLSPQPRICQLTRTLSPRAHHVGVHLILPGGEARARVTLRDAAGWSLLLNGDGAYPAPLGDPLLTWLERRLPLPAGYFSRALYGQVWDVPSLMRYAAYAIFAWASFWGWFGWLTIPYPWWVYGLLGVATAAAMMGTWRRFVFSHQCSVFSVQGLAAAAVGLISVQAFAPMLGQAWQPQGRYFFPGLLPLAILLTLGWEVMTPRSRRGWLVAGILLALAALNVLAWRLTR